MELTRSIMGFKSVATIWESPSLWMSSVSFWISPSSEMHSIYPFAICVALLLTLFMLITATMLESTDTIPKINTGSKIINFVLTFFFMFGSPLLYCRLRNAAYQCVHDFLRIRTGCISGRHQVSILGCRIPKAVAHTL